MPFILKTGNLKIKDANNQYHEVNTLIGDTSDAAIQEIKAAANDIVANVEGELTQQLNAAISNANEKAGSANTAATAANTAANTANNAKNNLESQFSTLIKLLIKGQWNEATTYSSGDYVLYNNKIYKCFVATSTVGQFKNDEWIESENSLVQRLNLLYNDIQSELSDLQIKWDNPRSETGIIQEWNKIRNSWDSTSPMFISQLDSGILQQWNTIKSEWDQESNNEEEQGLKQRCENKIDALSTAITDIDTLVQNKLGDVLTEDFDQKLEKINTTSDNIDDIEDNLATIKTEITEVNNNLFNQAQALFSDYLYNLLPSSTVNLPVFFDILATWENNANTNVVSSIKEGLQAILLGLRNSGMANFSIDAIYPYNPLISYSWYDPNQTDKPDLVTWYQKQGRWFNLSGLSPANIYNILERGDILISNNSIFSFIIGKNKTPIMSNNKDSKIQYWIYTATFNNKKQIVLNNNIIRFNNDDSMTNQTYSLIRPDYRKENIFNPIFIQSGLIQNKKIGLLPLFQCKISTDAPTQTKYRMGQGLDIESVASNPSQYMCLENFILNTNSSLSISWPLETINKRVNVLGYDENFNYLGVQTFETPTSNDVITITLNNTNFNNITPTYIRLNCICSKPITLTMFNKFSILAT